MTEQEKEKQAERIEHYNCLENHLQNLYKMRESINSALSKKNDPIYLQIRLFTTPGTLWDNPIISWKHDKRFKYMSVILPLLDDEIKEVNQQIQDL